MHHHHPPWHYRRRLGPLGRYVRTRLHRRIFAWFAGGIFTTAVAVAVLMGLLSRVEQSSWDRSVSRGAAWVGTQFAREWDDPARREAFARTTSADLDVDLELVDAQGASLLVVGATCRHAIEAPVLRDGRSLGTVRACFHRAPMGWRFPLGVGFAVLLMWAASGRVARRIARPLDELTEVVKRIGSGDLKSRAELSCYEPDEIGLVADAVNEMATRIEKQMADQRELLATVSHELRTPLARMRVIAEIARDTRATPKTFDDLDREVLEMDALVGQLLASSRVDFGVLSLRELSVRDLVLRALERAGLDASLAQIEGQGDAVKGDATLLARALANLLDNAVKHAGSVEALRATVSPAGVSFEVLDRGKGLGEGGEAALFEKFKQSSDGLGLGLPLVQRIAVAHGGRAWARNREGGGASVGFDVPVAKRPG